jgi:hypothetical protein
MIEPLKCFSLYIGIKTHFTNEKYDAIKHHGRTSAGTAKTFEARHDKGLFVMLAKQFKSPQQAASYFVANIAYGNLYPVTDVDVGMENYTNWQKKRQSLTKMFTDDLSFLVNTGMTYKELMSFEDGIPPLFVLMKNGKINIETLAIMNTIENFVDTWKSVNPIWKDDFLRVAKLGSFVRFDTAKFTNLFINFKEELKENHETMA